MKLKDAEPEVREAIEHTVEDAFAQCVSSHVQVFEAHDMGIVFVDTELGREKGVRFLSNEELWALVWEHAD